MNKTIFALLALSALTLFGCHGGQEISSSLPAGYEQADIKRGALLYDKWYKLAAVKVEGTHPAYPAEGKKSGASSWRCKECHGWDYIGKEGRYSKGSHFTGIKGLYDVRGQAPETLYAAIAKGNSHAFGGMMPVGDIWALVKFLREGLVDINEVITADLKAKGSAEKGAALYGEHCAACHADNGQAIDFKSKKEGIQGVGHYAKGNPQETIHKILWGHPGSDMPSLLIDAELSIQDGVDILAYSQTLD